MVGAESMNSGAQCPGFKSHLRQLPLQAQWFSPRAMALRADPTHRGAPFLGQPDMPGHTLCPRPSCAPAGTQGR